MGPQNSLGFETGLEGQVGFDLAEMETARGFPARQRKQSPAREYAARNGVTLAGRVCNVQQSCGRWGWKGSLSPGQRGSKARSLP